MAYTPTPITPGVIPGGGGGGAVGIADVTGLQAALDDKAHVAANATYTYKWDGSHYVRNDTSGAVPSGASRRFCGPSANDPASDGFTMALGDEWVETS